MRQIINFIIFFALAGILLTSCSAEQREQLEGKPGAFGRINNIAVIADEAIMNGAVGDTMMYYFTSAYPILPQPEPLFDVRHFTMSKLSSKIERKHLRTYIVLANTSDEASPTSQYVRRAIGEENIRAMNEGGGFATKIVKNQWAMGQIVFFMYANSEENLMNNIRQDFPAITKSIRKHEQVQLEADVFHGTREAALEKEVFDSMGIQLRLPKQYMKALYDEESNSFWLRKPTNAVDFNILLRKITYTDQSQLTKEGLKSVRDSLGKFVSSGLPDTYMKINDVDLPMYVEARTIDNNFALEAKGIWEIENDFMGGPFVSYLIHNPTEGELLFIDGFVYAPGEKKREYLQQLEYIISNVKF